MKKTGSLLREKRESAGLSISEVALATKINPKILTAIENGDEAGLPAKTFLKGFVRSYAIFLKMNVDDVLQSYQEEMGSQTPERQHEAYRTDTPQPTGRRTVTDENSSGMRTAAVIAIVILIGMIIGVRELIEKYQREKVVEKAENIKVSPLPVPPETQTSPDEAVADDNKAPASEKAADKPSIEIKPEPKSDTKSDTKTDAKPEAKPDVKAEVKPPAKVEPKPEVKPEAKPEVKAEAKPPAKPEVKADVKPVTKPEQKPEVKPEQKAEAKTEKKPAKVIKSTIILEALDKVEVKFQSKGQWKKISLAPSDVHTIRADQATAFEFSDGGSVNIIVDGHERGPPGELGKPKQVTLP
jgi:cytoskeleton protein RodZ